MCWVVGGGGCGLVPVEVLGCAYGDEGVGVGESGKDADPAVLLVSAMQLDLAHVGAVDGGGDRTHCCFRKQRGPP